MLAELGVNKEAKGAHGATALHLAADNGHVEAIKLLVQMGADKEAKTDGGATALHLAAVKKGTWRRSSCWRSLV